MTTYSGTKATPVPGIAVVGFGVATARGICRCALGRDAVTVLDLIA